MAGRTATEREALARQNAAIMAVFERAGFEQIAPDIIQPADIFLERSGEDIRARTFVFNDPAGNEMCLRPDLTVPACRYHLSHAAQPEKEARYCYLGPAFRFPDEKLSPQEFTQAGLEWFGAAEPIAAEARMLKLTISALGSSGRFQSESHPRRSGPVLGAARRHRNAGALAQALAAPILAAAGLSRLAEEICPAAAGHAQQHF